MPQYRKKPVVVEAHKLDHDDLWCNEDADHPDWLQDAVDGGIVYLRGGQTYIRTLEGYHIASDGDFIIQGIKGELYPCKPDIFAATYEAV